MICLLRLFRLGEIIVAADLPCDLRHFFDFSVLTVQAALSKTEEPELDSDEEELRKLEAEEAELNRLEEEEAAKKVLH